MSSIQVTETENSLNNQSTQQFCFCTLALGKKYRNLAKDLAADLAKFSTKPLVILTEKPEDFSEFSQVQAFKHQQQSIACYHDKRYVIAKALSVYDTCVFVDADMRILKEIAPMDWQPGISARSCANILQHYQPESGRPDRIKLLQLTEKIAQKFNLDLEQVNFVSEFMFAVTKDNGKEMKFLQLWEKIGNYFELNGVYGSEGSVIGLAAAACGLSIQHHEMPNIEFFNDKIDAIRVKKGQVDAAKLQAYFDNHQQKAFAKRSLLEKATGRIAKSLINFRNTTRLRVATFKDFNFYYN